MQLNQIKVLKAILRLLVVLLSISFLSIEVLAEKKYILKYAALAPEGSIWAKNVRQMQRELRKKSGGKLIMKPYLSGVAGDEKTMTRKLRAGSIDIASFSGMGLGYILPQVRVLELPMFFSNYRQVDKVTKALSPKFEQGFLKKGYRFAAWGEGGFVYLLSRNPIHSYKDMRGKRIWAPAGDKIVQAVFIKYGLVPTYLGFESVLPQLQTGGIDAIYGPPMAVIGLQWFQEVKYLTDLKLAYSTGATLINNKKFSKLPIKYQNLLLKTVKKYSKRLKRKLRKENQKGLRILQKKGIRTVKMNKAEVQRLRKISIKVQDSLVGKQYPADVLKTARKNR